MELLAGKVLRDRYQIQSLLGRQTGRRTFLASDLQTGSSAVVKLLLFGPDFTWDDLKLFEREANVLKSLDHPAIPKYLDYFEVETELGKGFALVQTYIEAQSLQDWVQSGRHFSEADLKQIARALLDILDYLHQRQPPVVHRDIKPSNILMQDRTAHSSGQVYLIDFGSVQTVVSSCTQTIVGTYGYMPLEQFGGQTTPASDLYALDATLIYLATGQHPDKLPQQKMRIVFEDRVSLSSHLTGWLKGLTEPSLELRPSAAKQVLEVLENSSLQESRQIARSKPAGSKIQVTSTGQKMEILIPPSGLLQRHLNMIGFIVIGFFSFPMFWNDILFFLDPNGWLISLLGILYLGVILKYIWNILADLMGRVRLRITQSEISQSF
ncbi:serine/threonine protein kinase [Vasconcelosia minhoensis]|uniref:serine/threonine protein kinase n=1 Tax=Vasconcelosia minhoensis TaxID=3366354 RepID=UPI001D151F61|nr:serine/threonine-protein kinase [Romeria gracilis]